MEKLTVYQPSGGPLVLQYGHPYWMSNLIGLDTVPVTSITRKGYRQDGQIRVATVREAKPISFNVTPMGNTMQETYALRRALIAALLPGIDYQCEYENDHIRVKFMAEVAMPPAFESNQATISTKKTCTISMLLNDPYLYAPEEQVTELRVETAEFIFPLAIPEEGFIVSTISAKRGTIYNPGDVDTPVRIIFLGGSVNPVITNLTTGKSIKVNRAIPALSTLEITTGYGNKRAWIYDAEGNKTNASQYIDPDVTEFWTLVPGENDLAYDADSGADSAEVYVYWTPRYSGV